MDAENPILIRSLARYYLLFMVDFPPELKPEHLKTPEADKVFSGLQRFQAVVRDIYTYFLSFTPKGPRWEDVNACAVAIEGPLRLLWALGVSGEIVSTPEGAALKAGRENLDPAFKHCGLKDPNQALAVLSAVGFDLLLYDENQQPVRGNYKKCSIVQLRYPAENEPLLLALVYYAARLPRKTSTKKSIIYEVFYRADLRPLLPGYKFHMPHLPASEAEVTKTFHPENMSLWRDLTRYMSIRYPQYRLFFRVPRIRHRCWVADYSTKDNDYGEWSMVIEEDSLSVRIVFNETTLSALWEHFGELTPDFQEKYLGVVRCKDCVKCGKHIYYQHGDHTHRLCKSPWFASPPLRLEDLPDIQVLLDCRLA